MTSIKIIRDKIDRIDEKLLKLISKRAQYALSIRQIRRTQQESNFACDRESSIFRKISQENPGPLSNSAIFNVFSEIISVCRGADQPVKVAYLGPEGTFSHLAALKRFGRSTTLIPQMSIEEIFHKVETRSVDVGIAPAENSLEGSVSETLDQFIDCQAVICGEFFMKIEQCLLSKEKRLADVNKVYSHPQALGQCRKWLRSNLPSATLISDFSTAMAVKRVMNESKAAAIGNGYLAEENNLLILADGIQDSPLNTTRFLLIGNQENAPTGRDKTSLIFATKHTPGALHRCLGHFALRGLNLTKIESRPRKNENWEYYFFVDVIGHGHDPQMMKALENLRYDTIFLKVLGSYPMEEQEFGGPQFDGGN